MVAWARTIYQYHVNGTDTVGRSVGQSVDARVPVDHASVGLTQARPNNRAYQGFHTASNRKVARGQGIIH